MKIFFIIASVIFIFAVFFLTAGYFAFCNACKRRKNQGGVNVSRYKPYEKEMEKALEEYERAEKEEVSITSFDGLTLCASYFPSPKKSSKLIIAFHGYHSSAPADFSCISAKLLENGFSLLYPDQRAHGRSEGKYIGFGALERRDCKSWCEYAAERFGDDIDIYLYGVSMGGATVLMSAELPLPKNVRAIVSDCAFTSPWDIIKNTLIHRHKIPPYPIIYFMNYWARQLAGFDFREVSSAETARKNPYPTLYIHGNDDTFVPTEMSKLIHQNASENCKLLLFDGARHARSYLSNSERYLYEMLRFLENL